MAAFPARPCGTGLSRRGDERGPARSDGERARLEHRYRVFLVCVIGIFVTVFDTSSSIVALPTIALDFGTDLPTAQWVIIGNNLTIAALLVPVGRLSDSVGRKRIYVAGCCLFAAGSVLAAVSGAIAWLILARIVVGVGSAMSQGTAMAILVGNFEGDERTHVLGWQTGTVGLGAIAGPATGGLIVGTVGWRALFAITAAAMVVIAVSSLRVLHRRDVRPRSAGPPFDFAGALLFSGLLVASLLTLTLGPRYGWTEAVTLTALGVIVALAAAFAVVERRSSTPMLDFRLFRVGAFGLGALSSITAFMSVSSTRFLAPFFLQGVKGFDPSRVGLVLLPGAVVTAVAGPFVGRFASRFGVRLFANIGIAIIMLGVTQFFLLTTATPVSLLVVGLMTIALGLSAFSAPNSTSMLNAIDAGSHGFAAGFVNLCRNTGNVLGIAFGTAIVTLTMGNAGFEPSLSDVGPGADQGLLAAFTRGVHTAAGALLLLTFGVLSVLVAWSWRARRAALLKTGEWQ
jgi:EmrB/QacA subfamily drug resistance transporter